DPVEERLWRGSQQIVLRPKSFSLLLYLLDNHGQLLSQKAILDAVWPNTHICDAVLRGRILEIRRALDDSSRAPKFIETVNRRGYRFIAQVQRAPGPLAYRKRARVPVAPWRI